ncbi:YcxB family protein [Chryseobacterium daeguense]|uniref:YcxB family protein n=1 Tax=Chryseobacterium daeguense TaxID=412438 RepID=UPI00041B1FC8|nr:YcxB family protein [Chryseobacterium daeguense]
MTVKTQITFKDFLMFYLKNSLIRLIVFPLLISIFLILNYYAEDHFEKNILKSTLMWFIIFLILIVIRSFFRLKKVFSSNKNIQENISYTFTNENIRLEGDTFDSEFTWDAVYRVKENNEWFLIYQSAQIMNMIPKKYFTKNQILELRNIIKVNNVKSKLRND